MIETMGKIEELLTYSQEDLITAIISCLDDEAYKIFMEFLKRNDQISVVEFVTYDELINIIGYTLDDNDNLMYKEFNTGIDAGFYQSNLSGKILSIKPAQQLSDDDILIWRTIDPQTFVAENMFKQK